MDGKILDYKLTEAKAELVKVNKVKKLLLINNQKKVL